LLISDTTRKIGNSAVEKAKLEIKGFVSKYICFSAARSVMDSRMRPGRGLNWWRKGVTVFEKSEQSIAVLTIGRAIFLAKTRYSTQYGSAKIRRSWRRSFQKRWWLIVIMMQFCMRCRRSPLFPAAEISAGTEEPVNFSTRLSTTTTYRHGVLSE
jgi:hypothetical protein